VLLQLWNVQDASFNPSGLAGILPGGAGGNAVAGSVPSPMLGGATAQPIMRAVIDNTAANPAIPGKLLVRDYIAANTGGALYIQNTTASIAAPALGYGIVNSAAASQGGVAYLVVDGPVQALCSTINGVTIAPGTLLGADANGNLEAIASPAFGEVLAISVGAMNYNITGPVGTDVILGGY